MPRRHQRAAIVSTVEYNCRRSLFCRYYLTPPTTNEDQGMDDLWAADRWLNADPGDRSGQQGLMVMAGGH